MGFWRLGFLSYHSRKVSELKFDSSAALCSALHGLEAVVLVETVMLLHSDMGQTLISETCVSSSELRFTLESRPFPSTEWGDDNGCCVALESTRSLLFKGKVIS